MDGAGTHLVLIPSYNPGFRLQETVAAALAQWPDVCVVVDGSDDGSDHELEALHPALRVLRRKQNGGKGAAVLDGLHDAASRGFSHVLVMDADGQHPAALIPDFMALSRRQPRAMILGRPVFDASAPRIRVVARRLCNALVRLQTRRAIGDALFGFRVYPVAPLLAAMRATRHMRRFDFDPEAVVRLAWRNIPIVNRDAPVLYFAKDQGGVSHFHYLRDNALLAKMHLRLIFESLSASLSSGREDSPHAIPPLTEISCPEM